MIFILTDDQGIWAAGCYGNPEIRTPNIDRLAATGVRFENFFCTSPVCSPSRASFLTGRIPSQHGVHDWIRDGNVPPDEEMLSDPMKEAYPAVPYLEGQTTYTDVMAEHGYTCAISGKWHLGDSLHPQHHFTRWFVHQKGGGPYNNAPMVRAGELVNEPGYVTNAITNEALKFLEEMKGPFYLSVHYTAPHSPWIGQHPQEIVDSYDDCPFKSCPQEAKHPWATSLSDRCLGNRETLKGYFAAVTVMDMDVGRILDRIEELGLREDTLIIFTSDNGYSCGHHGFWGKGNGTLPLNMYENSVKVPLIISHPGHLLEGESTDALVSGYDFMPTLLEYLDLPSPAEENLPGQSFLPVLSGEVQGSRDSVVVYDEFGPTRMIRTREWKYVHRYPYGPHELYDLVNDPDERENLIGERAQRGRVKEMRQQLADWFARYVDPAVDGAKLPVTGRGQRTRIGPQNPGENCFYPLKQG
ncbi:MAG: sulfatase-like hydrolase/transferase [Chloroflexota bacterium]|nr:sulfatase-like hydrolase/transferase [Chloroflexota bacterium]